MTRLIERTLLISILTIPLNILSQKTATNHELSVDIFNPLQIPGQSKYFNDSWLIDNYGGDEQHPQKRKYIRFGIGIEYSFKLKNKTLINLDFGIGYRDIYEELSYYYPNPMMHPDEVAQGATEINYKQISYGFTLFYGRYLELNKFNFNMSIGPSYLMQGVGQQEWTYWQTENTYPDLLADSIVSSTNSKFGIGHNLGLGIKLGANYYINNKISIGCDLSWFLLYSLYNNPSKHDSHYYERKSYDGISSQETTIDSFSEDFTHFNQFSFTNISPSLRITYLIK